MEDAVEIFNFGTKVWMTKGLKFYQPMKKAISLISSNQESLMLAGETVDGSLLVLDFNILNSEMKQINLKKPTEATSFSFVKLKQNLFECKDNF